MATDLVVAICTLDRPIGLRALLGELIAQAETLSLTVELVVIDNSVNSSASWVAKDLSVGKRVTYLQCLERGLSNVRNVALEYSCNISAPLAFIDDDEIPESTWLQTAASAISTFKGEILAGPVKPNLEPTLVENPLPLEFWERPKREDQAIILETVGNGNVVFPANLVLSNLRYSPRFNSSGGEDTDFILKAQRLGFKIRNLNALAVTESVPAARQTLEYLEHKALHSSNSWVSVMKANGSHFHTFIPSLIKQASLTILKSVAWKITRQRLYLASAKIHGAKVKGTVKGLKGSSVERQEKYQGE